MSTSKKKRYRRTHRHRANSKLRNKKSVRKHTRPHGRTGGTHYKMIPSSKLFKMKIHIPTKKYQFFPAVGGVSSPLETEGRTANTKNSGA